MESEWLEVAYINLNKAILHGRVADGRDGFGVNKEREIEQVLTDEQRKAVNALAFKHDCEMGKLLRSFVEETPA